jgi:hypothetical protein
MITGFGERFVTNPVGGVGLHASGFPITFLRRDIS